MGSQMACNNGMYYEIQKVSSVPISETFMCTVQLYTHDQSFNVAHMKKKKQMQFLCMWWNIVCILRKKQQQQQYVCDSKNMYGAIRFMSNCVWNSSMNE